MGKYRMGKNNTDAAKSKWHVVPFNVFKNNAKGARTPRRKKITSEVPLNTKIWEMKVMPENWFLGKVNVKPSHLVVETLKNRFTDYQKKMFSTTCFGHYLDVHQLAVNPQLIHQVLLREVNQPNDQEMWFKLGGSTVKFGVEEFYLITGLRCNGDVNRGNYDTNYTRLKNQYFSQFNRITNNDVFNVFIDMNNNNNRDVVIMGVLFLVTHLMYNTAYDRFVDEKLLILVDSINMNSYPWGQDIFKLTLSSLKQALRNKRVTVEGSGRPTMNYRLNDYVIAFQIWIYEILPILEMKLCSKVESKFPRILNWTSEFDNDASFLNISTDIFGRHDIRIEPIVIQVAERMNPNYVALKQRLKNGNPSYQSSVISITIDDDDDDFVKPPQRQIKNRAPATEPLVIFNESVAGYSTAACNDGDKTDTLPKTTSEIYAKNSGHETDVYDAKGKNVVYNAQDSDNDCEIVSQKFHPHGIHIFPGASSRHPVPRYTLSLPEVDVGITRTHHDSTMNDAPMNTTHSADNQITPKFDARQAPDQSQPRRSSFDKYTSRLDDIVRGHADVAVEMYVLKLKMQELQRFVEQNIADALDELQNLSIIRCSRNDRPKNMTDMLGKPIQRGELRCRDRTQHHYGKSMPNNNNPASDHASKSRIRNVTPLRDSTNTFRPDTHLQPSKSPVSCTNIQGSIPSSSRLGSNSYQSHGLPLKRYTPTENVIVNDSSVIGIRLDHSRVAAPPSDKGSVAKLEPAISNKDCKSSVNMPDYDIPAPSFDLGIDSDIHDGDIVLEDGLVLSKKYIDEMDCLAEKVLSNSEKFHTPTSVTSPKGKGDSFQHAVQLQNHSAPASQKPCNPCTKDVCIKNFVSQSSPSKKLRPRHFINAEISPIPINFNYGTSPLSDRSMHRSSMRKLVDVETISQTGPKVFFIYKTCLDTPLDMDIINFKKFYGDGPKKEDRKTGLSDDANESSPSTKLGPITIYSKMWWHDLHEVASPLNDTHIDAAFYFMRMLLKLRVGHTIRATTTDCNFDVKIRGISSEIATDIRALQKHESLFSYANGRKIPFNVHWSHVDHILVPMWIGNPGHWILGHLDMINWRFDIYNSLTRVVKNVTIYSAIRSMVLALPVLVRSLNSQTRRFPETSLECRIMDDCPQQENGGDCGIFVIKYAEYIIEGRMEEMPTRFDTAIARFNIATQLYKYMREEPDIIWFNSDGSLKLGN